MIGMSGWCGEIFVVHPQGRVREDRRDGVRGAYVALYELLDECLTALHGNYMQLPPEDQRQTHCLKVWRVNNKE